MTEDADSKSRDWFEQYVKRLESGAHGSKKNDGTKYACPCCGFLTLEERGGSDICQVCYWEDDGQDDHDAEIVRGGPNGGLSLSQARENFAAFKACEKKFVESVREPRADEQPGG